jgi:hypothetical protein
MSNGIEVFNGNGQLDGARAWCHVMYGLHALSALSGIFDFCHRGGGLLCSAGRRLLR